MAVDYSKLKRIRHTMPDTIRLALEDQGVMQAYEERPAYQQNDYIDTSIKTIPDPQYVHAFWKYLAQ